MCNINYLDPFIPTQYNIYIEPKSQPPWST